MKIATGDIGFQGQCCDAESLSRPMAATGQLFALPHRSIAVRFTPVSGIDSRSQVLPSRATSGREQMQQKNNLYLVALAGALRS
jgi:hypothetical protein